MDHIDHKGGIYTSENFPRNGKFSADRMRNHVVRGKFSDVYMHLNDLFKGSICNDFFQNEFGRNLNMVPYRTDGVIQEIVNVIHMISLAHTQSKVIKGGGGVPHPQYIP